MVPSWADQLLLQLLMEQFDTLPIQCRHIEHMHEGVYNFCLHRFYQNLLSKLRSAGLNYNSPSFFTESYCAGSNKHCLFTFFIEFFFMYARPIPVQTKVHFKKFQFLAVTYDVEVFICTFDVI